MEFKEFSHLTFHYKGNDKSDQSYQVMGQKT